MSVAGFSSFSSNWNNSVALAVDAAHLCVCKQVCVCENLGTSAFVIQRSARSAGKRQNYHLLVLCQHPVQY